MLRLVSIVFVFCDSFLFVGLFVEYSVILTQKTNYVFLFEIEKATRWYNRCLLFKHKSNNFIELCTCHGSHKTWGKCKRTCCCKMGRVYIYHTFCFFLFFWMPQIYCVFLGMWMWLYYYFYVWFARVCCLLYFQFIGMVIIGTKLVLVVMLVSYHFFVFLVFCFFVCFLLLTQHKYN